MTAAEPWRSGEGRSHQSEFGKRAGVDNGNEVSNEDPRRMGRATVNSALQRVWTLGSGECAVEVGEPGSTGEAGLTCEPCCAFLTHRSPAPLLQRGSALSSQSALSRPVVAGFPNLDPSADANPPVNAHLPSPISHQSPPHPRDIPKAQSNPSPLTSTSLTLLTTMNAVTLLSSRMSRSD